MKPNDTFKCRFAFQVTEQASKPLKYQESKRTAGDSIGKPSAAFRGASNGSKGNCFDVCVLHKLRRDTARVHGQ